MDDLARLIQLREDKENLAEELAKSSYHMAVVEGMRVDSRYLIAVRKQQIDEEIARIMRENIKAVT